MIIGFLIEVRDLAEIEVIDGSTEHANECTTITQRPAAGLIFLAELGCNAAMVHWLERRFRWARSVRILFITALAALLF